MVYEAMQMNEEINVGRKGGGGIRPKKGLIARTEKLSIGDVDAKFTLKS